jgi:scyllo-inositol 2-dehydrogenase (NADP+)
VALRCRRGTVTVRIGLIGYGLAGGILHASTIAAVPRLRVAAVVTSRGAEVRARFPDAAVLADPHALFADSSIDAMVVATPNDSHAALARAALESGKHVVVDKPFVVQADEGAALIRLARERGRVLTVFHNRRWDGDFLTVREVIGRLGAVRLAELHWDRFRPVLRASWKDDPAFGGGLLADLGPHLIDQALTLFGTPDAIAADIAAQREGGRIDDYMDLTLLYPTSRVRLAGSVLVVAPRPRFALYGTEGSFVKGGIDPQEDQLKAGARADDAGFGDEVSALWGTLTDAEGNSERITTRTGAWRGFYEAFADAVERGAPLPVDPVDALAGLRLAALARESAVTGRIVTVDARALRAV